MFDLNLCILDVDNTQMLTDEEFAMIRRQGIGASDSAAILGAYGNFKTRDQLLAEKLQTEYTDAERDIGQKVAVRKGKDLEEMILRKAAVKLNMCIFGQLCKLNKMYRIKAYPYLTVNFDGLYEDRLTKELIPVEAKFVTTFGDKYYDFEKANSIPELHLCEEEISIEAVAKQLGIPPYYLVQVQHQLLATGASYAWLAALRDKDWTLYMFRIPRINWLIENIIVSGNQFWNQVENLRRLQ